MIQTTGTFQHVSFYPKITSNYNRRTIKVRGRVNKERGCQREGLKQQHVALHRSTAADLHWKDLWVSRKALWGRGDGRPPPGDALMTSGSLREACGPESPANVQQNYCGNPHVGWSFRFNQSSVPMVPDVPLMFSNALRNILNIKLLSILDEAPSSPHGSWRCFQRLLLLRGRSHEA